MRSRFGTKAIQLLAMACFIVLVINCSLGGQPSLKETFKNLFYIGTALNYDQIRGLETASTKIIEKQFNSITPENILKWESIHPEPNKYNFAPADSFVALGEKNNMFMVGHTLIWHYQTPAWVFEDDSGNQVDRETLLRRMRDHIFAVVGRYKGRINGWDVVNEAVDDNGQPRKSNWMQIIGEDYLQKAFEWAHEADPDAELYYNDYNLWIPAKRESVVQLVRNLQSKGVHIDGIGLQGHWGLDYPPLDELEASIVAYSKLDVQVMITELDLNILPLPAPEMGADIALNFELQKELNPYPEELPDSMQEKLANRYAELFMVLNKHHNSISRVTLWGVHDGQSWSNNWPVRGRTAYPLLFDRKFQPKPAFYAVIKTAEK
jgi:endo-1,4-beta-xylanase